MALETERTPSAVTGLEAVMARVRSGAAELQSGSRGLSRAAARMSARIGPVLGRWWQAFPLVRFVGGTLQRRILVASLAGLVVMIGGILYFSENNSWLLEAKRESLKVQGEIIAAAIAGDAHRDASRQTITTDDVLARAARPSAAFAAHELSIRPERVAPIVRRLIQPTTRRARVYSRDGTLVIDSATLLQRGQLTRHEPKLTTDTRMRPKTFWTRLKSWMLGDDLPVYREIGNANGTSYPEVRKALDGTLTAMLLLNEKGEQIVSTAVPIKRGDQVLGVLLMSTPPGEIDKIQSEERELIWILAAFAMIASLLSAFVLARTVAGPIRRLSASAEHVSRDISARHELPDFANRTDEVGRMASAFAAMTGALYRRAEASENFAADVAHELKNPLAAARSMAEALSYARTEEQRQEVIRQIQNELSRLNRLITDVSNASRLDAELARQQTGPVDVTDVASSVSQIFRDILSGDSRRVETKVAREPFHGAYLVKGHAGRLGQVLTNLVDNAVSFSPDGGVVAVAIRRDGEHIELSVEDEGPGIPADRVEIIFDRFYTDRPDTEATRGKNSGLGLSISRDIVRALGGEISAANRYRPKASPKDPPEGARFVVRLPALTASTRSGVTVGRRAGAEKFHEPARDRV